MNATANGNGPRVEYGRMPDGSGESWMVIHTTGRGAEVLKAVPSRGAAEEYARFLKDLWLFLDTPGVCEGEAVALLVDGIKGEVQADIAAGIVPATVSTFAALHDHVDANGYGGAFNWPGNFCNEYTVNFWDRVQDGVDEWLKAGRP